MPIGERVGVSLPAGACQHRDLDCVPTIYPADRGETDGRGLSGRPRPLASMLRPEFSLAFVGSDRLARFGGVLHLGGSDLGGSAHI
jgi:hypothetical protein